MRGLEGATALVKARLEARMPDKVAEIVTRLGIDPKDLPRPGLVAAEDRPRLDPGDWPALMVVGLEAPQFRLVAVLDGADEEYQVSYRLRVYVWIRASGFEEVERQRARMMLGVREALLEKRTLADAEGARVDPSSMRESYSDLAVERESRSVGGAYLEFLLVLTETLTVADLATAASVDITGLPPHPALD
jgi:hypothetical protein